MNPESGLQRSSARGAGAGEPCRREAFTSYRKREEDMTRKPIILAILLASIALSTTAFAAPHTLAFTQLLPIESFAADGLLTEVASTITVAALGAKAPLGTDFLTFLSAGEVTPLLSQGCVRGCRNERRKCLAFCEIWDDDCFVDCFGVFENCVDDCACQ